MAPAEDQFTKGLVAEFRRRVFEESIDRIRRCLDELEERDIWHRPNARSNSIGNLILHLEGNARQWILSGLGGRSDDRQREAEFAPDQQENKTILKQRLDQLEKDLEPVLQKLDSGELLRVRPVQVYEESGLSILIHVVEHFAYHTGQIVWITKALTDRDLGFYAYLNPED